MINDLTIHNKFLCKFVGDTTISETIAPNNISHLQGFVDKIMQWSTLNKFQLNSDKCKELRVSFAKTQRQFSPIMVNGKELEIVPKAKLLGLTISSNLTWNAHVRDVIKKASKRIYFLIELKRANVSHDDLKLFYITCIRSILDYAAPVFHYSLPKYLMNEMERIQKRVMGIIFPDLEYRRALEYIRALG